MYIKRQIEDQIKKANANFPVILLTGSRQVGKSRTLLEIKEDFRQYVTLDDPQERNLAKQNPNMFLKLHKGPLIIDEIQYAPELFSYIKINVDRENKDGLYWLTGSQVFPLMQDVRESLAGRVMVLRMQGIAQGEEFEDFRGVFPDTKEKILEDINKDFLERRTSLHKRILRGSFPRMLTHEGISCVQFYSSYVQTWLERDVAQITNILDRGVFFQFVQLLAGRSGQELNKADISKDIGVDAKTVDRWIEVLETSGLVYRLPAWSGNVGKRLIKRPKIYFLDTGLLCYLCGIETEKALISSPLYGAIYETFVVSEILKRSFNNGAMVRVYYYRDTYQKEIDIIIDNGEKIYPFEIKSAKKLNKPLKNFKVLDVLSDKIDFGGVISHEEKIFPLTEKYWQIPDSLL